MSERKTATGRTVRPTRGAPARGSVVAREQPLRLLVVDDEALVRRALSRLLGQRGMEILTAEDDREAVDLVRRNPVDLVLTDVMLGGEVDGLQLLDLLRAERPSLEAIVMSGHDQYSQDDALRAGALEFIRKDLSNHRRFLELFDQALDRRRSVRTDALPPPPPRVEDLLVGGSEVMSRLRAEVAHIARRDVTTLVLGETGTGKELIARALHGCSARRAMPFVSVNCGAISETLIDSELFGHLRGAFTGAIHDRAGRFREADGGTLFLDEVGELSLAAQVKLLRVLQEREVQTLGAAGPVRVDIRLVAATHRDLKARVRDGTFREDLYFRLNVFSLRAPPLRERMDDLDALVEHLLGRLAQRHAVPVPAVGDEAMARMRAYAWPGNVRELENAVERAVVLAAEGGRVTAEMLPEELRDVDPARGAETRFDAALLDADYAAARERVIADFTRFYCAEKVRRAGGNVGRAAESANVDRANFRRLLRRLKA